MWHHPKNNRNAQKLLRETRCVLNSIGYQCKQLSPEDFVQASKILNLPDTVMSGYQVEQLGKGNFDQKFLLCYRGWVEPSQLQTGGWCWFVLQDWAMSDRQFFIENKESLENLPRFILG